MFKRFSKRAPLLSLCVALGSVCSAQAHWPQKAVALSKQLQTGDAKEKIAAISGLSHLSPAESREPISRALLDDEEEVRFYAAQIALAKGFSGFGETLDGYLQSPSSREKIWAVRLVAPDATVGQVRLIAPLLADFDPEVRLFATIALGQVPQVTARAASELLFSSLGDADARVRQAAATALGRLGSSEVAVSLSSQLRDTETEVRVAVALALGALGDTSSVGPLVGALGDPEDEVVAAAARSLGLLEDAAAVPGLLSVVEREPFGIAEEEAAWALARIGETRGMEVLVRLLARSDARSDVLELLKDTQLTAPVLDDCLKRAVSPQLEACATLHFQEGGAVAPVLRAVADGRLRDSEVFRVALGIFNEELLVRALQNLHHGKSAEQKLQFELAAAYLRSLPVLPDTAEVSLLQVLEREARTEKEISLLLILLGQLEHPNWSASFEKYLAATVPNVQRAAARLLVQSGIAGDAFLQALTSDDSVLAQAAVDALSHKMSKEQAKVVISALSRGQSGQRAPLAVALYGCSAPLDESSQKELAQIVEHQLTVARSQPRGSAQADHEALLFAFGRLGRSSDVVALWPKIASDERLRLIFGLELNAAPEQALALALEDSVPRNLAVAFEVAARRDVQLPSSIPEEMPHFVEAAWLRAQYFGYKKSGAAKVPSALFTEQRCTSAHLSIRAAVMGWSAELGQPCAKSDPVDQLLRAPDPLLRWVVASGLTQSTTQSSSVRRALLSCSVYETHADTAAACEAALSGSPKPAGALKPQGELVQDAHEKAEISRVRIDVPWARQTPALVPHPVVVDGILRVVVSDRSGETIVVGQNYAVIDPMFAY